MTQGWSAIRARCVRTFSVPARWAALVAGALALALAAFAPTAVAAPTAAEFGALPQMESVSISPKGSAIAYVAQTPAGRALVIQSLTGAKDIVAPFEAGGKVRYVEWASDDVAILTVSVSYRPPLGDADSIYELWRAIAYDAKSGKRVFLTPGRDAGANLDFTVDAIADDGSGDALMTTYEFAVGAYRETAGTRLAKEDPVASAFRLVSYRVDTRTGASRRIAEGDVKSIGLLLRGNGDVAARMDLDPAAKTFAIMARDGRNWSSVFRAKDVVRPPLTFAGLGATPDQALVIDRRDERGALKTLDLKTGALEPAPGVAGPVDSLWMDRFSNRPVAAVEDGLETRITWIDPALKAINEKVQRAFPRKLAQIQSWTTDRTRVIVRVSAGDAPAIYYLLDVGAMRAEIVGERYPQLAGQAMGAKTLISYAARDGAAIPAFLTLPPGKTGVKAPLVILPHGGPEANDDPDFDWFSQFLATRGYAVLQPQFRGSSGLGAAWANAGRGQWGGRMQDDLTDGVKAMIAKGIADPKRVCIVGASYGGYAALAGAAYTPDLYACAASVNGVSDLNGMLAYLKKRGGSRSVALNYWIEHFGDKSDSELAAVSPVNAAASIQAKMLLVVGRDDTVVPAIQTRAMALAMTKAGKSANVIELAGEDHWLSSAETRVRMLEAIEGLLRQSFGE